MELSNSKIKKLLYFLKKAPHTFQPELKKTKKSTPKKISCISGNRNPRKASFIRGNGTFQPKPRKIKKIHADKNLLYFGKWNFLSLRLKNF